MSSPAHGIDVADVRRRHPIEEVIAAAGIELLRSGRGTWPAARSTTTAPRPTRWRVPDRYHCFGCGATGDVIDFIGRLHGLGFRDAVAFLDDQARMPLTRSLPGSARASPAPRPRSQSRGGAGL